MRTQLAAEVAARAEELPEVPQLLLVHQGWPEAEGGVSEPENTLESMLDVRDRIADRALDKIAIRFWKAFPKHLQSATDVIISDPLPLARILNMFQLAKSENNIDVFEKALCYVAMRERIIAKGLDV